MMNSLESQYKEFAIVVGKNDIEVNIFKQYMDIYTNCYGGKYVFILHDKDATEYEHYHVVIICDKRVRKGTILNRLANILDCDKVNISVMGVRNLNASIQYLLHINNNDKYQYAPFELISNMPSDLLSAYLSTNDYEVGLNAELLLQLICDCSSKIDLIRSIGLSQYQRYRSTINDLWNTIKHGIL